MKKLKNFWNFIKGNKSQAQNMNPSDSLHLYETSNTINLEAYQFHKFPNYVGQWEINSNFMIQVEKKPNFFHAYMARLLLGWKYIEFKDQKRR